MNFDRVAPHYRRLETVTFGSALEKSRNYWVRKVSRPKRALIVGEGNGRFLCELLRVHPGIEVDCVDASLRMLEVARARVRRLHPASYRFVRFIQSDVLAWSPSDSYDLMVTHFFLDCFNEKQLRSVVSNLASAARENSIWLIADFTVPLEVFARAHAMFWLRTMYAFFRVTAQLENKRLVDPRRYLEAERFARIATETFRWKMIQTEIYARSVSGALPDGTRAFLSSLTIADDNPGILKAAHCGSVAH
jgi:ubiquinone/menaquinone biosynthesis C-methylase UbiE